MESEKRRTLAVVLGLLAIPTGAGLVWGTNGYIDWGKPFREAASTPPAAVDPDRLYALVQEAERQGELTYATDLARRLTIVAPRSVIAHKQLAALLLKQKRYEDARVSCEEALKLSPRDAPARLGLAAAYGGLRKPDAARRVLRSILEDPTVSPREREAAQNALSELDGASPASPAATAAPASAGDTMGGDGTVRPPAAAP